MSNRTQNAWVVFTNQTEIGILRCLKRGYRHCFIIINDEKNWISIDPMAHYMDVIAHDAPADFDLPQWLENRGHTVIKAKIDRGLKTAAPLAFLTCVETCKRVLGIRARHIITPWQLYRYIELQGCNNPARRHLPAAHTNTLFRKGELRWEV